MFGSFEITGVKLSGDPAGGKTAEEARTFAMVIVWFADVTGIADPRPSFRKSETPVTETVPAPPACGNKTTDTTDLPPPTKPPGMIPANATTPEAISFGGLIQKLTGDDPSAIDWSANKPAGNKICPWTAFALSPCVSSMRSTRTGWLIFIEVWSATTFNVAALAREKLSKNKPSRNINFLIILNIVRVCLAIDYPVQ